MKRCAAWLIHWFCQGLKLLMLSALPGMAALFVFLPFSIIASLTTYYPQTDGLRTVLSIIGMALSLAIFTALLTDFLKDYPLRTPAEQKAFLAAQKEAQSRSHNSAGHS